MQFFTTMRSILFVMFVLAANISSAYLTPGPSHPHEPPPQLNPYPGNPYPSDPYPSPYPPQDPYYPPQQPPYTPPQQPGYGSCAADLCVGERVYNISREYREAVIVGIESAGTYVLRFSDTNGVGGNWSRSDLALQRGCAADLCVGVQVFNVSRESRRAQVVGIHQDGKYVLRFLDTNGVGGNWSRTDLAVDRGCSGDLCVGAVAYNISRDYRLVQVVGIQYDGRMVLRFQDTGGVGGNWSRSDLAIDRGCGNQFCVGQYALNNKRNYRQVQIVAIDVNRNYVLKFIDTGAVGGNWTDADLVRQ